MNLIESARKWTVQSGESARSKKEHGPSRKICFDIRPSIASNWTVEDDIGQSFVHMDDLFQNMTVHFPSFGSCSGPSNLTLDRLL